MSSRQYRVVLGVVGNDVHIVALRLLDIALQEIGIATCNLGVNRMLPDFIAAASAAPTDAILFSSLNGEAEIWCNNVRELADAAGLFGITLYIGGNLQFGLAGDEDIEGLFKGFGFDRVYSRRGQPAEVANQLLEDLKAKSAS